MARDFPAFKKIHKVAFAGESQANHQADVFGERRGGMLLLPFAVSRLQSVTYTSLPSRQNLASALTLVNPSRIVACSGFSGGRVVFARLVNIRSGPKIGD